MNDFAKIVTMLANSGQDFIISLVEGEEHPGIEILRPSIIYDTEVYISFNGDGSLFSIHAYEPEGTDE